MVADEGLRDAAISNDNNNNDHGADDFSSTMSRWDSKKKTTDTFALSTGSSLNI